MQLLRVVAIWTDAEKPGDDRLTFDVLVDGSGVAIHKYMTFGFMGSSSSEGGKFYPFGIRPTGFLANARDDGDVDEDEEHLNIFGKTIQIGETITFRDEDDEYLYRIAQILKLPEMKQ
jgi:hypothetical protein